MKTKERYLLLLSVIFLAFSIVWRRQSLINSDPAFVVRPGEELNNEDLAWLSSLPSVQNDGHLDRPGFEYLDQDRHLNRCTMETCFNLTRCAGPPFLHYVYPVDDRVRISPSYMKILRVLKNSPDYTDDPDKACLFILSLDTLDRDKLSEEHYIRDMQHRIDSLDFWNGGLNHIVFNLYSGTYPDYSEDVDFDIGKAILAKASLSEGHYRQGFDVSIPLFHPHHPEKGGLQGFVDSNPMPATKEYFLAFKGKRYVYGIGSETRNSLYHLHNGEDIVLLTTCKHGKSWKSLKDERCDDDNLIYDRWDYDKLLQNSTFCLVPRGRRLGSFRFIETLQAGCLPVVMSNEWILPFSEIIDYSKAVIVADERLLLQLPELLRSISEVDIHAMRQQTQVLWDRFFNSFEVIVDTTLKIVHERIRPHLAKPLEYWNIHPARILAEDIRYLNGPILGSKQKFSAQVHVNGPVDSLGNTALVRLLRNIGAAKHIDSIRLIWSSTTKPRPSYLQKIVKKVPIQIVEFSTNASLWQRFPPSSEFSTQAVLSVDFNTGLTTDEVNFLFSVWQHFPERLVGIAPRSHHWDVQKRTWRYSSKWTNAYSMVSLNGAMYHSFYHDLLLSQNPSIVTLLQANPVCSDVAMNLVISKFTSLPPIKVSQRKETMNSVKRRDRYNSEKHNDFASKQTCLNAIIEEFGRNPLKESLVRFDPILFKDPVSNVRKKYRKMEVIPALGGYNGNP